MRKTLTQLIWFATGILICWSLFQYQFIFEYRLQADIKQFPDSSVCQSSQEPQLNSPEELAETAIYLQSELLAKALAPITQSHSNTINMYSLLIAGDGDQEVFRSEIESIKNIVNENYSTESQEITLVNSREAIDTYPLATKTSIAKSLHRLAENMNREQDILLFYITSHGSEKAKVSLDQKGLVLGDMESDWLAEELSKTGIQWKVLIVSACYSGTFIPALADEKTLVITAAAADRNSFGCSDDNDMTWFGRAFFKQSLQGSGEFIEAYHNAVAIVETWETEQDVDPSKPQIKAGAEIADYLEKWRQQRRATSQQSRP